MGANFKPMYWSKYCQTELKKDLVLSGWCDYQFEGEVKLGSRLKIVGATRPTIQQYTPGKVDDIDRAQSMAGYLETQFDEAKIALAESADAFVGTKAADANSDMMSASTDISGLTSMLAPINQAHIKLYANNVSQKTELAADLTPEHIVELRSELQELFTDNVEYVKRGALGKYANTYLRLSNNLYNDGTDYYEMVRTKKAIAFAGQIDKVETARKEKGFADIIKGLHVYGAKLVRPKELYVIRVH